MHVNRHAAAQPHRLAAAAGLTSTCCAAGFCKQQLWPLFHYVLPMSPISQGRYDQELWQAYVKANKVGIVHLTSQSVVRTSPCLHGLCCTSGCTAVCC
jgi:hypothetical protein